jgi:hypothetical protein
MKFKTIKLISTLLLIIAFMTGSNCHKTSNNRIAQKLNNYFDQLEMNHVVLKRQQLKLHHTWKEIYIKNLINDSVLHILMHNICTSINLYDSASIGDTLIKEPFNKFIYLHKKHSIDTITIYPCKLVN